MCRCAQDFSNMDKCFHKIKVPFKKVVHNNYIQKTQDKLSKLTDNSKLYLYNKIKHDIVLEEYLIQEKNFKNKQLIVKFRTSDHCLQIETGRYINIPRQQRICINVADPAIYILSGLLPIEAEIHIKVLTFFGNITRSE